MKVILFNGDSLGMPREGVPFDQTYYYLLSKVYSGKAHLVSNFRRAATTTLLHSKDSLEIYQPNIVVLHLGIVDCAPRYYKSSSNFIKIINRLPGRAKSLFWVITKKIKKRTGENADVSLSKFEFNLMSYLIRCEQEKVERCILILIQKPGTSMLRKNPNLLHSIGQYNELIVKCAQGFTFVKCINPLGESTNDDYIADGYHLKHSGFLKVFDSLKNELDDLI